MALDAWAAIGMLAGVGLVVVAALRDHVVAWAHEPGEPVGGGYVGRMTAALGTTLAVAGGTLLLLGGVLGTAV